MFLDLTGGATHLTSTAVATGKFIFAAVRYEMYKAEVRSTLSKNCPPCRLDIKGVNQMYLH